MKKTNRKRYVRVYTSQKKRKVKKENDENRKTERRIPDCIHNEIVGEFSMYGMTVRYWLNNPYFIISADFF